MIRSTFGLLLLSSLTSNWRTDALLVVADPCIQCHVVATEVLTNHNVVVTKEGNDDIPELQCWTKLSGRGFREALSLTLPESFVKDHWQVILSGRANVCLSTDYLLSDDDQGNNVASRRPPRLIVPTRDAPFIQLQTDEQLGQRRLNHQDIRAGQKRLLAVRVLGPSSEETPLETPLEIQDNLFGSQLLNLEEAPPTVVSQYAAISHGALKFVAATGEGIHHGVAEVPIDTPIIGQDIEGDLMIQILSSTAKSLGDLESVADHIIFCLPTGSLLKEKPNWTAFTYLFEPYSYYQESRCTRLSVPIHEIGHSLGFKHSGRDADSYGDESGYMGYAMDQIHFPRKAFNAHKHWVSGWFHDRAVALEPLLHKEGALALPLVSFVDASLAHVPDHFVAVARIGDLYLHYNRAKGYNNETSVDQKDRVTITSATAETEVSYFAAALASTETYHHLNYDGNRNSLVIQVCDLGVGGPASNVDYATVSIHLDDGVHRSLCGSAVVSNEYLWAPTSADTPVAAPSLEPRILFPTGAPSTIELDLNVVPTDHGEAEVLVEDPKRTTGNQQQQQQQQPGQLESTNDFDVMFVLLLAIGGTLFLLAGAIACCVYRDRSDKDQPPPANKKQTKLDNLDLSETEDSEREEEACIVEIRRISSNGTESRRLYEV